MRLKRYTADRYYQIAVADPFEREIAVVSFAIKPEYCAQATPETPQKNCSRLSLPIKKRRQDRNVGMTPLCVPEGIGKSAGVPVSAAGTMAMDAWGKALDSR